VYAVAAVFETAGAARLAVEHLRTHGVRPSTITFLAPGTPATDVERTVSIDEGESPGMGAAVGGVVGAGMGLAAASVVFPGVGPVIVAGLLAAGIAGAAGERLEERLSNGLPRDELAFYGAALRRGRAVIIVVAVTEERADEIRDMLGDAGAESVDPAHADWAIGLHDAPRAG
jgi:hypothetical protein